MEYVYMVKKCSKCKLDLDIEMFNKKGIRKDGTIRYQDFCRECNKIASREWYRKAENKQRIIKKVTGYKKENRIQFNIYKSTLSCVQCGESHPSCLDFHHRDPTQKDFMLSDIRSRSLKSIQKEINKCDVLCANCHRKLHWNERNM